MKLIKILKEYPLRMSYEINVSVHGSIAEFFDVGEIILFIIKGLVILWYTFSCIKWQFITITKKYTLL
jgi:hypothetical protein